MFSNIGYPISEIVWLVINQGFSIKLKLVISIFIDDVCSWRKSSYIVKHLIWECHFLSHDARVSMTDKSTPTWTNLFKR
jgi:hypothetical protein